MGDLKAPIGPNAVHVCVDMQRLFAPGGPWPAPWMERVLPIVVKIAEHSPARCVFTRFIPPETPAHAVGMWRPYYEKWPHVTRQKMDLSLLDLLAPLDRFVPPAHVVDRPVYSGFAGGALQRWLTQKHVDTLIVTGSETDVCVLATVLSAVDAGYRVIVVRDALCSSSDRAHDAMLDLYAMRFDVQIELVNADQVLAHWLLVHE